MRRVLVTGATGNIGREVVEQLRDTGCRIRALSRNPEVANLSSQVEVVYGDLTLPDTLDESLREVDAIFLVWVAPLGAAAAAVERIASRVQRIVLISSPHRTAHPFFQQPNVLRGVHAGVEQLIEASGVAWTFVRPGVFALNCLNWWGPQIRCGDVVRWFYADAATAPIDERDIAAVAVQALSDPGPARKEYVITGPESLTQREQLQIIGETIGRWLRYEELSREAARQQMLAMMPGGIADMLLDAYAAAVGRPAYVTSTVRDVTGTPARSFRDWVLDHADEFTLPAT
jgi:uncharacterized protein YbjT (DUF2867 family)